MDYLATIKKVVALILLMLFIYLLSWAIAYFFVLGYGGYGFRPEYLFEYFYLEWISGRGGREISGMIRIFSLILFPILFAITYICYKKCKKTN